MAHLSFDSGFHSLVLELSRDDMGKRADPENRRGY